jgi:hypothetical protein
LVGNSPSKAFFFKDHSASKAGNFAIGIESSLLFFSSESHSTPDARGLRFMVVDVDVHIVTTFFFEQEMSSETVTERAAEAQ